MKVLFVFNHPAPYKVELLNRISKSIDIMVLFERKRNKDRNPSFYSSKIDFPHKFLKGIPFSNENFLSLQIKKHIKKNKYDLIIMNGYSTLAEMIAINYLIKHKIPYVLYVNGGVIRKDKPLKLKLKRKFISNARSYYSPNEIADAYLIHYGARKKDIRNYPYSTISKKEIASVPFTENERKEILNSYNLPLDKPLFITAGQFIDRKNNLYLLEVFLSRPQYNLVIVGEGEQKELLEKYIKEHNMNNVYMLPFLKRNELFPLIKASSAFITLSKEDIYGHVINEALSQGKPVISSSKVVAAKTLIKNGENGFVVNLIKEEILSAIDKVLTLNCFKSSTEVAKMNTYEGSAEIHIKLWKEEI